MLKIEIKTDEKIKLSKLNITFLILLKLIYFLIFNFFYNLLINNY